jgi:hypothetical protein
MAEDGGLITQWEPDKERELIDISAQVEKEYRKLRCGHEIFVRNTGRTRGAGKL